MSRVTYFIVLVHTGTGVSHSQDRKNSGEVLEKMEVNGSEGEKIVRKKSLAVCLACMAMYGPTPCLKGRAFELWVVNRRVLISAFAVARCRVMKQINIWEYMCLHYNVALKKTIRSLLTSTRVSSASVPCWVTPIQC